MNYNVFSQLNHFFLNAKYIQVNPTVFLLDKIKYKIVQKIGFRPIFPIFSRRRLNLIKRLLENSCNPDAEFNFFHGSTSWLLVDQKLPYFAYLDASFQTYISVYHREQKFSKKHLSFLYEKEKKFLENARAIFFSSEYALNEAKVFYGLKGANFLKVGMGSGIIKSHIQKVIKKPIFLFVGLDFYGKGGDLVLKAFEIVNKNFIDSELIIVGCNPLIGNHYKHVIVKGKLDKSEPTQLEELERLYSESMALVLPSNKDMTPLVIAEAAAFSCPAISVNRFGIKEMVQHNITGWLLSDNDDIINELSKTMIEILSNPKLSESMGNAAQAHVNKFLSWDIVGQRLYNRIIAEL